MSYMIILWISINLFGLLVIYSHLGEREHREHFPLAYWKEDKWAHSMILIAIIGIVINVGFLLML